MIFYQYLQSSAANSVDYSKFITDFESVRAILSLSLTLFNGGLQSRLECSARIGRILLRSAVGIAHVVEIMFIFFIQKFRCPIFYHKVFCWYMWPDPPWHWSLVWHRPFTPGWLPQISLKNNMWFQKIMRYSPNFFIPCMLLKTGRSLKWREVFL